MKKATYTPDEYNSQQTGNYKGLTLEQLMVSCKRIIHTGSESMCDVQDTLARMQDEEIATVAMTDKETFLKIAIHAWNVENTFKFYNKWLSPLHGVYQGRIEELEQEAGEAINQREQEITRLNRELESIKSALSVLTNFVNK
jgi:hypothetical protein